MQEISQVKHAKFRPGIMGIQDGETVHLLFKERKTIVNLSSSTLLKTKENLPQIISALPAVLAEKEDEPKEAGVVDFSGGTLFLTSNCNLRCVYCYSSAGEKKTYMSMALAEGVIRLLTDNAKRNNVNAHISFHGEGEPTENWRVLTKSVELTRKLMAKHGLKAGFSISTNGVISKEKALWLSRNIDNIQISFDGPSDIQNVQRPKKDGGATFQAVMQTARILRAQNKPFHVRTTLTAANSKRMEEIASLIILKMGAKSLHIEPVSIKSGRGEKNTWIQVPSQSDFVGEYTRLCDDPRFSKKIDNACNAIFRDKFCGAAGRNFGVTSMGFITACHEVTDISDPRSKFFIYGRFNQKTGKPDINSDQLARLGERRGSNIKGCDDCFAEFACAGGCLAKCAGTNFESLFTRSESARCETQKGILLHLLREIKATGDTNIYLPNSSFSQECTITLVDLNNKLQCDTTCHYCNWLCNCQGNCSHCRRHKDCYDCAHDGCGDHVD